MKRIVSTCVLLLTVGFASFSQELKSAFFLDNYLYGYKINPAIQPNVNGFFGFAIGNFGVGGDMNVGIDNFLFPVNDKLVSGFNKNVSAEEFVGGLPDYTKLSLNADFNVFSLGRRSRSGQSFRTYDINLKSIESLSIPKGMFEFLKVGNENNEYIINDVNVSTRNYLEFAFGYSRDCGILSFGTSLKGLVGLADVKMNIEEMSVKINGEQVDVHGSGVLRGSLPKMKFAVDDDGNISFDDTEDASNSIAGYGAAIDLGIVLKPIDNLMLSASVCDLGFISWKNGFRGEMNSSYSFGWSGEDDVEDNLEEMIKFKDTPVSGSSVQMLPSRISLGAKYNFLCLHRLSAGALLSFRLGDSVTRNSDLRLGLTYTPGRVISITGTYGVSSYQNAFGAAVNLRALGLNFFAEIDGIFTKVTPQYAPVGKFDTVVRTGLSIAWGRRDR